jgi:hypothetical protein
LPGTISLKGRHTTVALWRKQSGLFKKFRTTSYTACGATHRRSNSKLLNMDARQVVSPLRKLSSSLCAASSILDRSRFPTCPGVGPPRIPPRVPLSSIPVLALAFKVELKATIKPSDDDTTSNLSCRTRSHGILRPCCCRARSSLASSRETSRCTHDPTPTQAGFINVGGTAWVKAAFGLYFCWTSKLPPLWTGNVVTLGSISASVPSRSSASEVPGDGPRQSSCPQVVAVPPDGSDGNEEKVWRL